MENAEGCIFCRIVARESPANIVLQDDQVTAFLDIHPVTQGHTLVVPNAHTEGIADLESEVGGHLFNVGMSLAGALRQSVKSEGINLWVADGEAAGQEVAHFHLHIIPRYRSDGFGSPFPPGYPFRPETKTLDEVAFAIREALAAG